MLIFESAIVVAVHENGTILEEKEPFVLVDMTSNFQMKHKLDKRSSMFKKYYGLYSERWLYHVVMIF